MSGYCSFRYFHWLNLFSILFCFSSCSRFFMPVRETSTDPASSGQFISGQADQKYFIIRKGNSYYHLQHIVVDKTKMVLTGDLSAVDKNHQLYLNTRNYSLKYKDDQADAILNEVHIYVTDKTLIDSTKNWVLPLDQIVQIEVIRHDKKRTNSSYILGGIGIGLGVLVLAGVIIALTKSSCPFISVMEDGQYVLQGELFGGAVNRQLERTDYVPLRAVPVNGRYWLRISNELRERQFTNFADLLIVEHPEKQLVFLDEKGQPVVVSTAQPPTQALLNTTDIRSEILAKDARYCGFDDSTATSGINNIQLQFSKINTATNATLLLSLKNSYWFDYLYGEFTQKFGSSYAKWQEKQKNSPAAEQIRWTEEQHIPLSVAVKTAAGWMEVKKLKSVGPLANRTMAIPVPLEQVTGDKIEIRLTTGFMFWELDYAAMDFTATTDYPVTRLSPVSATDQDGLSCLPELSHDDSLYLSQPEAGQYADISYAWNRLPGDGNTFSVFLHTKGYYVPVRNYSGDPDFGTLYKFRTPGELARFSLQQYKQIPNNESIIVLNP